MYYLAYKQSSTLCPPHVGEATERWPANGAVGLYQVVSQKKITPLFPMNTLRRIYAFYRDGFRSMTVGRILWAVILIKLFVMFGILKPIFFPHALREIKGDEARGAYIMDRWIEQVEGATPDTTSN